VFVDDGSTDSTPTILNELGVNVLTHEVNKGKGAAVRTGVMAAQNDIIVCVDADGAYPPSEVRKVWENINDFDIILGMKRHKDSVWLTPESKLRTFLGRCFNAWTNALFHTGVNDCLCGLKGYKKWVGKQLFEKVKSNDWLFDVEMLYYARKQGLSIYECPVKLYHVSDSKFKLLDPIKLFFKLIWLRMKIK
jgi:dolichyl-phosphate beta-glucosyltransferase